VFERLRSYLRVEPVGHALSSPADISWGPDTLVQPDVFVAPLEQARTLDWTRIQDLLLVVEVLSPSTARYDRFTKRRLYQEVGVPVYWLVDGESSLVEVWTPDAAFPQIERDWVIWHPAGAHAPFTLGLSELFRLL